MARGWTGAQGEQAGSVAGSGPALTTIPLMDTQQFWGKSCSMGTRNWRQPSQWQSSSIMPMRLMILITALARS